VSDVGGTFGGELLTLHRYVEVEGRHLQVVAAFLDDAEVDFTIVRGAESYDAHWWPEEGERLSRLETIDLVRALLRDWGFCRLEAERDVYIHVGYDYYLYVGGEVDCKQTLNVAAQAGLFVETDFTSPYHLNPETGQYLLTGHYRACLNAATTAPGLDRTNATGPLVYRLFTSSSSDSGCRLTTAEPHRRLPPIFFTSPGRGVAGGATS
jgi:hypothetical protein